MDYDSMKLLMLWKMYQAQFMLKLGFNTNTHDQNVFANTRNNFYSINVPNDRMRNVQKRNGLKQITVHGLRHTYKSEEHTSELQSRGHLVCRLLLEKKNS